mmetsp:Transcript_44458/g.92996  ORF Transcript_44458/g.92996 Transcript_44458/m.92996 type:complete len:211 (+) Transcript_44458:601-1233(+)
MLLSKGIATFSSLTSASAIPEDGKRVPSSSMGNRKAYGLHLDGSLSAGHGGHQMRRLSMEPTKFRNEDSSSTASGNKPPMERVSIPALSSSWSSISRARKLSPAGTGSPSMNMCACTRTTAGESQEPCWLTRAKRSVNAMWCQLSSNSLLDNGPHCLTVTLSARLETSTRTKYVPAPLLVAVAPSRYQRNTGLPSAYESMSIIGFPPTTA